MKRIEFYSVFDAHTGLALLRLVDPDNKQWEHRDHNFGSLKYNITDAHLYILKDNRIGFMILDNEPAR